MTSVTIADRRTISIAASRADFRDLLRSDPRAAFERATGRAAPQGVRIEVIEESPGAWEFVVPSAIEADLPEPGDARGVIENNTYAILRDEPAVRADALADPKGFLADRLKFDIGDAGLNLHEEAAGEVLLVLPHADSRDELNEAALDLVAGGMPAIDPDSEYDAPDDVKRMNERASDPNYRPMGSW